MIDWIKARRSIRRYTAQPVTNDEIEMLLEAAMAAPSASNLKPWEFVVVREAHLREELSRVHRWSDMAAEAPVVFVVSGRPEDSHHWVEDCSAATQNLLLAATALGLGSVWVAMYPGTEREEKVRQLLHLPEGWRTLCILPVGYPAEHKASRTQYDPAHVHFDRLE